MTEQLAPGAAPESLGRKRNRNFEETHAILTEAFQDFLANRLGPKFPNPTNRQPTIKQLSEITGIPKRTVERHLTELDRDIQMARRSKKIRLGTELAMRGLLGRVAKGDVPAIRTWLEVVENIKLGTGIKIEMPDSEDGPDLSLLSKEDLAAYKALVRKLTAGKRGDDGSPKPGA